MFEPVTLFELAAAALAGLALVLVTALRGWRQWLDLKRLQASDGSGPGRRPAGEIAELRRRVRKLEAIANGIEL